MHNYTVKYRVDGNELEEKIEAVDVGAAFVKCLKLYPKCRVISAYRQSHVGGYGYTEYDAPPIQREPVQEPRPSRALNHKERGCELAFYDEVKTK